MNAITKRINWSLFILFLMLSVTPAAAQLNHGNAGAQSQLKNFNSSLAQVNMTFNFPEGFKEIKAPTTESFQFDYAMVLPDADFEIWLRVNTQKENEKLLADKNIHVSCADSLYLGVAQDQISSFTSEKKYMKRNLPEYILNRYNADGGSIYLVSIDDSPVTKHYKYAFLTVLQKNKIGTLLAICFTNDKGPEFFKDMNRASNCVKFRE
ncbi:hypothetical protein [Mucilaginibacter sp. UR6-11]|uniref:hypothetical protein n=1 Tax=Mucilaginibacter sp. UR6-11 TaxID=1435644 RepID=UPI001E31C19C|nr:hypothetical protein [Mucilaginibacter sp. UR6-11]MCC8424257.1 hypothetical protein [Mucilaginibacter sp. UR6-11]